MVKRPHALAARRPRARCCTRTRRVNLQEKTRVKRYSRRRMLRGAAGAGYVLGGLLTRPLSARADWRVLAVVEPADGARLRPGPSVRDAEIAILACGESVRLLDGPNGDGW